MSLKDFFKNIGNAFTVPPVPSGGPGFKERTNTLPNGAGSYQSPTPAPYGSVDYGSPDVPIKSYFGGTATMDYAGPQTPSTPTPGGTPPPSTPAPSSGGKSGGTIFKSTPITPTAPTAPEQLDYSKYTNPETGKPYTPQEYADVMAKRVSGGSIPNYAGDVLTKGPQTVDQLERTARELNNARNDIATGTKDPYEVASRSGLQLTPSQLKAVENAYAGVYTPALEDVFSAISNRKKVEEDDRQAKIRKEEAAAELENDLLKMKTQFEYDKKLKSIVAPGSGGSGSNQQTDNERAAQTLFQNNPIVKDYNTIVGQKNAIDRIIMSGVGGPADVNAIFAFMKALDPNSVVRESEYETAAKSGNLFQGVFTKFNGYFKDKGGILPENVKQEFQNLIGQKLASQAASYNNVAKQTRAIVQRQGLNPDNVVIDFSGGIENLSPKIVTAPDGAKVEIVD